LFEVGKIVKWTKQSKRKCEYISRRIFYKVEKRKLMKETDVLMQQLASQAVAAVLHGKGELRDI
jgi:hypothetical protein